MYITVIKTKAFEREKDRQARRRKNIYVKMNIQLAYKLIKE